MSQLGIDRRSFMKALGGSMLVLPSLHGARSLVIAKAKASDSSVGEELLSPEAVSVLRERLLHLVNEERAGAGLSALQFDDLASSVAADHARDMAKGAFLSHWGRDGLKPYHRYSFRGGVDATAENVGAVDHLLNVTAEDTMFDVIDAHRSMYNEKPPNDGHRKAILTPQHTHVGFGIAAEGRHVRLSELFVSRYVVVDKYEPQQQRQSSFTFSGRVSQAMLTVQSIDVYYEPLPSTAELLWLRKARPYALPESRNTLFPRLEDDWHYQNGSKGDIEIRRHGKFRVRIQLGGLAGIYTIVVWLRPKRDKPFPATEVCIRAE